MRFALTGFYQNYNIRRYLFQGIGEGGRRTDWNVDVDLTMLQRYGIPIQEAPLLCSVALAAQAIHDKSQTFMIPESHLRARAAERASERTESQNKSRPASLPFKPQTSPPDESLPEVKHENVRLGLGSRPTHPWSANRLASSKYRTD